MVLLSHYCCHPGFMLLTLHLILCEGDCCQCCCRLNTDALRPVKVISWPLSSINDRIQLLLQTMDVCDEWLDHVGTGGHAVWANVLSAYAQLHLVERPHKLRQVTTHTSFHSFHLLSSVLRAFVQASAPS